MTAAECRRTPWAPSPRDRWHSLIERTQCCSMPSWSRRASPGRPEQLARVAPASSRSAHLLPGALVRVRPRDRERLEREGRLLGFRRLRVSLQARPGLRAKISGSGRGREARRELWVPAKDLPELNAHIRRFVEIIEAFPGDPFDGELDPLTHLPAGCSPPRASAALLRISCSCCRCLTLAVRVRPASAREL